jgi:hypothetical protein
MLTDDELAALERAAATVEKLMQLNDLRRPFNEDSVREGCRKAAQWFRERADFHERSGNHERAAKLRAEADQAQWIADNETRVQ